MMTIIWAYEAKRQTEAPWLFTGIHAFNTNYFFI